MNALEKRLSRAFGDKSFASISLGRHGLLTMGLETITPADSYLWEGMKRGVNGRQPIWLFQFTLFGWGIFETRNTKQKILPGQAMCVQIPSRHRYRKDPGCRAWRFFWIIVNHPYVVGRLLEQPNLVNALIDLPENTPALEAGISLFLSIRDQRDTEDVEGRLFFWLLALERFAFFQRHPKKERVQLLDFVRNHVRDHLDQFVTVAELGKLWGVSRSNFAHHFRKITGLAPASYIRDIRIQEAARLLQEQKWSIKEVAAMTGFSNATNLGKCFRAHLQISPRNYQRLAGGKIPPLS